jgi:purine-binding chemotaxis protein CheW
LSSDGQSPDFVVLFRARGSLCALPVAHVLETMRPLAITPLSQMPAFMLGLSLIRGAAIPIVDVGAMLGADSVRKTKRFVTLRIGERSIALAVEEVLGVREISPASLQQLPPLLRDASAQIVSAIGTLDAEFLLVLRVARILSEQVRRVLDPVEA